MWWHVLCKVGGGGGRRGTRVNWGFSNRVLVSLSVSPLRRFGGRARHLEEGIVTSLPYLLGCLCFSFIVRCMAVFFVLSVEQLTSSLVVYLWPSSC